MVYAADGHVIIFKYSFYWEFIYKQMYYKIVALCGVTENIMSKKVV